MGAQLKKNLQDLMLNAYRRDRLPVVIFLLNGFQLKGVVTGFDSFVVVLMSEGKQQMIYKHAISTLIPARPVIVSDVEKEEGGPSEGL